MRERVAREDALASGTSFSWIMKQKLDTAAARGERVLLSRVETRTQT